jgi:uncharacterized phiE125 gp8 family phage protein
VAALANTSDLRDWLRINNNNEDSLLDRLITAVSANVESYLNRKILVASYTEWYDGTGTDRLLLTQYPVTAVQSVMMDGVTVSAAADATSTGWSFDDVGIFYQFGKFTRNRQNVKVTYTAGYATAPQDIQQAVLELASMRYRERDRIGHASKSVGGETTAFVTSAMPDSVKVLLNNWRNVTPV